MAAWRCRGTKGRRRSPQILVVGQDGMALGGTGDEDSREVPVTEMVEQPAKVMRIGSMIKQLLEEVRAAPLDEASRVRLKEIHASSVKELEDGLAPELVEELERLSLPFTHDATPSDAELRIAQAQLVGWLEGLFHGSRRPCSPSRWRPGPSWSRCAARSRRASVAWTATRTRARVAAPADRTCSPGRPLLTKRARHVKCRARLIGAYACYGCW